jgi:hypothetical protein
MIILGWAMIAAVVAMVVGVIISQLGWKEGLLCLLACTGVASILHVGTRLASGGAL